MISKMAFSTVQLKWIGVIVGFIVIFGLLLINTASIRNMARDNEERSKRSVDENDDDLFTSFSFGGAIYIRWGRHECPVATETVYKGWGGGGWYDHTGGGANYVCLTEKPVWGQYHEGDGNGYIYGSEFQIDSRPGQPNFPFSDQNRPTLHQHNMPCIVCRSLERITQVMIPGTSLCMEGWTREYDGYLVAGHYGHKGRNEYICLDGDPEANENGYRDENGALVYSVKARCGSLPCPPYVDKREITCVVCTK